MHRIYLTSYQGHFKTLNWAKFDFMGWTAFIGPVITCVVAIMKVIYDKRNKRNLDWFSWVLIILAIIYLGFEVYNTLERGSNIEENQQALMMTTHKTKDTLSNRIDSAGEKINNHADVNRDSIINAQRRSNDSLSNELTKKNIPAFIDAIKAPFYAKEEGDSVILCLVLRNFGGRIATHINTLSFEIEEIDSKFSILLYPKIPSDYDDALAPNADMTMFKPVLKSRVRPNRKLFWHLVISYKDGSGGKGRPYNLLISLDNPGLTKLITGPDPQDYTLLRNFLMQEKMW